MKKSSKMPKKRNPIAKNLNVNKPKVVPDKKKKAKDAFSKAKKPQSGGMDFPTYGV